MYTPLGFHKRYSEGAREYVREKGRVISEAAPKQVQVAQPRSGDVSCILSLFVRTYAHLEICYRKQFHKQLKPVQDSIERDPLVRRERRSV